MVHSSGYDYLIIGAGPAGLQAGYFLQKMQCRFLILESASSAGSFFTTLPRHGKLISINKIFTGYTNSETRLRYDWNSLLCDSPLLRVSQYSSRYFPQTEEYQRYLQDFAHQYQLPIRYQRAVRTVTRTAEGFEVIDQEGERYQSKRVIVATGLGHVPHFPPIAGIELGEHYQHYAIEPKQYQDQRVLIIGKGNAAFETANMLIASARVIHICSPNSVKWAWETHFMGHVRTINAEFLDTFYLKGQNAMLDAHVEKLERRPEGIVAHITYTHAAGQTMQLIYDRVLVCTGYRFDTSIFDQTCQPELFANGRLPAMTAEWESTNVKDLYFVGTLMQMRDHHKTMSNVIHGFRFNILFLCRLLAHKYHGEPWPYRELSLDPAALNWHFLERASHAAALFLQPGFLCDLCILEPQGQKACYLETVPLDCIPGILHDREAYYYTLTLEYGRYTGSPRHLERDPDPQNAHNDYFLHPIIRYFHGRHLLCEQHLPENLESNWLPQRSFILTTEVPGKYSAQEMLGYDQQLQAFLRQHVAQLAS
ncbi:MAG TPA: NAD(P)-binding domain-containing protein [Ktedonobacteraceae bacterium]|jgi:thioredoxin reductase